MHYQVLHEVPLSIDKRYTHAKSLLRERPYNYLIAPLSLLYIVITAGVYYYIYNGNPIALYKLFPLHYTIPFTIFTIIISLLIGLTIALFFAKLHELHLKSAGVGVIGVMIGSLAAGCPGCFFGLFPLVLSFFGVTGTLAILPWNGLEFQVITISMLSLSVWMLAKETDLTCKVKKRKK